MSVENLTEGGVTRQNNQEEDIAEQNRPETELLKNRLDSLEDKLNRLLSQNQAGSSPPIIAPGQIAYLLHVLRLNYLQLAVYPRYSTTYSRYSVNVC